MKPFQRKSFPKSLFIREHGTQAYEMVWIFRPMAKLKMKEENVFSSSGAHKRAGTTHTHSLYRHTSTRIPLRKCWLDGWACGVALLRFPPLRTGKRAPASGCEAAAVFVQRTDSVTQSQIHPLLYVLVCIIEFPAHAIPWVKKSINVQI